MKATVIPRRNKLALVKPEPAATPPSREAKLQAAIAFLGDNYVLAPDYRRRVRVGFLLTAWCANRERERARGRLA